MMCLFRMLLRSVFDLLLVALLTMVSCLFAADHSVTVESPETKITLIELFTSERDAAAARGRRPGWED